MLMIAQTAQQVRSAVAAWRAAGRSIGFVPTMGALHAGHASLIDAAVRDGHAVVASIFVNPTQFGPNEDFGTYPRTWDEDLRLCGQHGVSLVFAPQPAEMYPPGDETRVRVGRLADRLCGAWRPGHFEGVCTVVAKLFHLVQPDAAYFGQKDAQQAVILRRMVADLFMPVRMVVCPIVREPDGLAMSSRNAYLAPAARRQAAGLYRALQRGRDLVLARRAEATADAGAGLREILGQVERSIRSDGPCEIQYVSAVDPETLEPRQDLTLPLMLALAVKIGGTRLIDNVVVA